MMTEKNKLGRPTDAPKVLSTRIRLSAEDIIKLEVCATELQKSKAEVVRMGIDRIYKELKR